MFSLFWVAVCVVAQLTNTAMHVAAILLNKIRLGSFMTVTGLLNKVLTNTLKSDSGGDLRAVHHSVEQEAVIVIIDAKCPVADFREDGTSKIDTDYSFDLPH
jgi:hypothetical protein